MMSEQPKLANPRSNFSSFLRGWCKLRLSGLEYIDDPLEWDSMIQEIAKELIKIAKENASIDKLNAIVEKYGGALGYLGYKAHRISRTKFLRQKRQLTDEFK